MTSTPKKLSAEELAEIAALSDAKPPESFTQWAIKLNDARVDLLSHITALSAELREARKDSERLSWLEVREEKIGRYIWEHDENPRKDPYPGGFFMEMDREMPPFYGKTYREAIDNAMAAPDADQWGEKGSK